MGFCTAAESNKAAADLEGLCGWAKQIRKINSKLRVCSIHIRWVCTPSKHDSRLLQRVPVRTRKVSGKVQER